MHVPAFSDCGRLDRVSVAASGILFDQQLRAKGEGQSTLTNPYLFLRRRYGRLYGDYKPQFVFWKLLLFLRKFVFAVIIVMLDANIQMQVSDICPRASHSFCA
jgi:hypothetical protein